MMEDKKKEIKYWQYRKSMARKGIKSVALIGCPMFTTCVKEFNEDLMKTKKETLKWAKSEIKFADMRIKKLKEVV